MKTALQALLANLLSLLPPAARGAVCRLLFSAAARANAPDALREMFQLQDALLSEIDRAAIRMGGGVHPKIRILKYPEFFACRIHPGERVLDVGCAFGLVALKMAEAGAVVTGIDMDATHIEQARRTCVHPNLKFVVGDATVTLPDETYDTVVLSNVLEHIRDRAGFLRSIAKKGHPRRWLLRVPALDRDWQVEVRRELGLTSYTDPTHFTEYTQESFRDELSQAGLRITHLQVAYSEIWAEAEPASAGVIGP
jgi:SAM-dependent methyltransferase